VPNETPHFGLRRTHGLGKASSCVGIRSVGVAGFEPQTGEAVGHRRRLATLMAIMPVGQDRSVVHDPAIDRRRFLYLAMASTLAACSSTNSRNGGSSNPATSSTRSMPSTSLGGPTLASDPFGLGVGSGDPFESGVTLWTRLVGDVGNDVIPVAWEIATDERFETIVQSGRYDATVDLGHAIHIDIDGLEPGREFAFRFRTRGYESPIGRTRTAPQGRTSQFTFATASCQEFQEGYYAAWRDAASGDLDAIVFLGDYIYEHGISDAGVRRHEAGEIFTLEDYRARYATYRSDPDLRSAHAACPWIVTWDDHEVSDNYATLAPGFSLEGPQLDSDAFRARRVGAYRAWYEHMPVRMAPPVDHNLKIDRSFGWGSLAKLVVLDTRQYRSDQTCNSVDIGPMCDEMLRPDVTLLGDRQHRSLEAELDRSGARWNLIANQVLFAPMPYTDSDVVQLDSWDGYPLVRRRVTQFLDDHGVRNPVILTGDIHLGAVFDVHARPDDPTTEIVATELVTTSISSTSDAILAANADYIRRRNEHLRWIDFEHRGYTKIRVEADRLTAEFRVVDRPEIPDSPVSTAATFVVPDGQRVEPA
jgi:alkaline phosphatase D